MFALAVVALTGPSLETVIFVVMMTSIPNYGRVARTQTLSLRNSEFIVAERAMGASTPRILGIHVLPNIVGVLAVLAAMDIPTVIALEAGLSFLGMGVKPADTVLGLPAEGRLRPDPPDPLAGHRGRTADRPRDPGVHLFGARRCATSSIRS